MMDRKEQTRLCRNDLLFIGMLLAVLIIAGACLYLLHGEGDTVTVSVDGKVIATYPLSVDRTEDILTEGDGLNRLIIKDGKAYVETASCPDGICAAHKPIHRQGESIVCLPNRVVVAVTLADNSEQPDVVI